MQYAVRRNVDGFKEAVFKLEDFPLRDSRDFYRAVYLIAPQVFPGVPAVPAFFRLDFEGEHEEIAVLSINQEVLFSANILFANC